MKVGFLGPEGSFSELAAKNLCPKADYSLYERFSVILKDVSEGKLDAGVVPIENSIEGSIIEVVDNLFKYRLFIDTTLIVPIKHCCAALSEDVNPEIILSHPQALGQCSEFISKTYPKAKLIQIASTSLAFKRIKEESLANAVAIGPEIAAEKYSLKIIKRDVQNNEDNQTKFALVTKKFIPKGKGMTTSVVVIPTLDRPGLLFDILKCFKDENLNLTKIESRPSKNKLGTYVFHIDIDGNYLDKGVKSAIENIGKDDEVVFLGSYNQSMLK